MIMIPRTRYFRNGGFVVLCLNKEIIIKAQHHIGGFDKVMQQETFKPTQRKRRRKSEINMMMSVDDSQDTGFPKRDFAVRVDVP